MTEYVTADEDRLSASEVWDNVDWEAAVELAYERKHEGPQRISMSMLHRIASDTAEDMGHDLAELSTDDYEELILHMRTKLKRKVSEYRKLPPKSNASLS